MEDDILTIEILEHSDSASRQFNSIEKTEENSTPQVVHKRSVPTVSETAASADVSSDEEAVIKVKEEPRKKYSGALINNNFHGHHGSKGAIPSPLGSTKSFDLQVANWRMEKLEMESKSGSEEEFYDCLGESRCFDCVAENSFSLNYVNSSFHRLRLRLNF